MQIPKEIIDYLEPNVRDMNKKIQAECPDCKSSVIEISHTLQGGERVILFKTDGKFIDGYLKQVYDEIKQEKADYLRNR